MANIHAVGVRSYRPMLGREKRLARIKLVLWEAKDRWLTARQVSAKLTSGHKTNPDSVRDDLKCLLRLREVESRLRGAGKPILEWRLA